VGAWKRGRVGSALLGGLASIFLLGFSIYGTATVELMQRAAQSSERGDEEQKLRDLRAELKAAQDRIAGLGVRRQAEVLTLNHEGEGALDKRGALYKATTDRAKAEGQIAAVKGKLDEPAAVGHAKPTRTVVSGCKVRLEGMVSLTSEPKASRQFVGCGHRLLQPVRHIHLPVHRGGDGQVLRALLAVNPFAPAVQTAARLWGCDRSSPPRKRVAAMPFKAFPIRFDHRG
jgi:hypothetical protein